MARRCPRPLLENHSMPNDRTRPRKLRLMPSNPLTPSMPPDDPPYGLPVEQWNDNPQPHSPASQGHSEPAFSAKLLRLRRISRPSVRLVRRPSSDNSRPPPTT